MLIDARDPSNLSQINADIAIIGAGAAGLTIANEFLEDSRFRVVVLESGGESFDRETQELYDGQLTAHQATDLTASRLRFLGGTTNHWGGHCLPLDPIDFEDRFSDAYTGWPLQLDQLRPFYVRAHDYCDIGDFNYDNNQLTVVGENLLDVDAALVETVVNRQSTTRFGRKFREPIRLSDNVVLYTWANVTELIQSEDGFVAEATVQTLDGKSMTVRAPRFVLAAGAIENARLLLASRSRSTSGIGNDNDLVGRYYMDHLRGGIGTITTDEYVIPAAYSKIVESPDGVGLHTLTKLSDSALQSNGLLNASFWLTPIITDPEKRELALRVRSGIDGLKSIAKYALGRPRGATRPLSEDYCSFINSSFDIVRSSIRDISTTDSVLLRFEAEQTPDITNRVSLLDERDRLGVQKVALHWAPSARDWESIERSAIIFGQAIGQTGVGRLQLQDKAQLAYWGIQTAWHQMGTTRMAEAPDSGVVDSDSRVFGVSNLFIAGGSVFPTGGRSNPTLTIVALAIRLADYLKSDNRR